MKLKNKIRLKPLYFLNFCICLLMICSLALTHIRVKAAQPEKEKWEVTVSNITKNVGDTVTKSEVLSAVTTTAMGKSPVTKTLLKKDEPRFPFEVYTDGYYSFPVQVIYSDGSITEVVVKVVTTYDTTPTAEDVKKEEDKHAQEWERVATNALVNEEKVALADSLKKLLALIQENPNKSTFTKETVDKYVQAQNDAYEPYKSAFQLLKNANLTLDELQEKHQDVKSSIQNIELAKKDLTERKEIVAEEDQEIQKSETSGESNEVDKDLPKTGDNIHLYLYLGLFGSLSGLILLSMIRRKAKNDIC